MQFLNRTTGAFNATMMDESFQLATCALLSNVTVEVKGWQVTHIVPCFVRPTVMFCMGLNILTLT